MSESLPIIDISPFLHPSPTSSSLATTISSLRHALDIYGFFYLVNHGVPASQTSEILSLARQFFTENSPAGKAKIKRLDPADGLGDGARGYQVMGENVTQGKRDWSEAIDWYRPVHAGEGATDSSDVASIKLSGGVKGEKRSPPFRLLEGVNFWPEHPSGFREKYEAYVDAMLSLGTTVMLALGHALDLSDPEYFVSCTRKSSWVMRAIGYPPLSPSLAADGGISCGEHSDYGCLTLLLADGTRDALQVRTKQGEWLDVQPLEGAYVVNVGDMVELWTGGRVRSTRHRVLHRGVGFRVSVPFFFEPDAECLVEVLEEFKVDGVERKGIKYEDHLKGKVGGNFYGGEE